MRYNFFCEDCKTITEYEEFGLCDEETNEKTPARIDTNLCNKNSWQATVKNKNRYNIEFFAIDHCVVKNYGAERPKVFDCLLRFCNENNKMNLYFVELKDRKRMRSAIKDAHEQLESTIKLFRNTLSEKDYKGYFKKVFIANRKENVIIDNDKQTRLWHEYGVRLDISSTITLK
jgi:hypothetical protein